MTLTKIFRSIYWIGIAVIVLFGAQGCKKSSGSGAPASPYYFSASINGQAWAANSSSNSYNSPALAGLGTSNGTDYILVLGIKSVNKDTSAFELVFPQNLTINQAYDFNASQFIAGAYAIQTSPGSSTVNGYSTSTGSITVITYDKTAKIIEGTFSGGFTSSAGAGTLQVTNGKFRCPYIDDVNQLPDSGLKF